MEPHCAKCKIPGKDKVCMTENEGRGPEFCPTMNHPDVVKKVTESYHAPEVSEFARLASVQEAECYANRGAGPYVMQPSKSRVQEVVEFAGKLGCRKLGMAFCVGLHKEAGMLEDVLESHGFEVVSVCCKAGAVPKEEIGIKEEEKVRIGTFETMCNPILQAEMLNREETDLNIVIGLCVGHDSLFLKHANAFCTVLAAKDRVTGHNPLAALYTMHTYYQKLKDEEFGEK